jgi:hypothetical protein
MALIEILLGLFWIFKLLIRNVYVALPLFRSFDNHLNHPSHNPKVAGSSPAPATTFISPSVKRLGVEVRSDK